MATVQNPKFAKIKAVTLDVLKAPKGTAQYLFFMGPMYQGKKIDDTKEAATLIHSLDMETGQEGVFIVSTVARGVLAENYPGDAYVGKGFEIVVTRDAEKKYNHVAISEVAVPEDVHAAAVAIMKAARAAEKADNTPPAASSAPAAKSGKR